MIRAGITPIQRLPQHPHRFRLSRAGIHQVWQYDEIFTFGGGRLLLRGKNGAGKSKALEMLLPFLLDGDPRRIDATGSGKTTLKWLMLDGWTSGTNRLGYLWLELSRIDEEGQPGLLTVGAAIKASTSTGEAKPTYFVTSQSAVDDLALHDPTRRPGLDQLRELVRPENCYERAVEYRSRVARDLFGITDLGRYRNLIHLLHGLRRPTIGDRIEAGELAKVLTEALPPLDDDILDEVARNLDDLDTVRTELARLERTDAALTTFLKSYRGYLRGVLRSRVALVRASLKQLGERRRAAGDAERLVAQRKADETETVGKVRQLEEERDGAAADLRAIRDSVAYQALGQLRDRREAVDALGTAAGAAWQTADLARSGERDAARRLGEEAETLGTEVNELRGAVREARRQARGSGLDESLLGEPPAVKRVTLAAALVESIPGVDGEQFSVDRPPAAMLDPEAETALMSWREHLDRAGAAVKGKLRTAGMLRDKLVEVAKKFAISDARAQDVERLETQISQARERQSERGVGLLAASTAYAGRVHEWTIDVSEVDTGGLLALIEIPIDADVSFEDRALDRELPQAIRGAAHDLLDPVLTELDERRDEILARERLLAKELTGARDEKRRWEAMTDPEPPAYPYANAWRDPRTGAPLFLLVDFADGFDQPARAHLEAALQASGLLNGWVCADGTVLADDTQDVLLRPVEPVIGPTLAGALRPAPPTDCAVSEQTVARLLASIGLGESQATSWVADDGRWRLGVAHGAYTKAQAEYVGAGARAATRARRIAELSAQIAILAEDLEREREARTVIEDRRAELRRKLRDLPDGQELIKAWVAYDEADAEAGRLSRELAGARREAEQARAAAVRLRDQVSAQASADGLPADADALAELRSTLDRLGQSLAVLIRDVQRTIAGLQRHKTSHTAWERARERCAEAERRYLESWTKLETARRELRRLEQSIGASEQEILASEQEVQQRLNLAETNLPAARSAFTKAHDSVVRAETERDAAKEALAEQEQRTVETSGQLRRPLGMPGLSLAAELDEVGNALEAFDAAQAGGVRDRIAALRVLAEDIEARLGPASADVGDSAILRRGEELRDGLSGGFDAAIDETDGVKRFELHDDVGTHDVALVGQRIKIAAEEARQRLSSREQEVFERYLLGELGDHLARQVLAAGNLVKAMNDTLNEVRSSHGIGARLVWQLPADADADVKAAAALLQQTSALRTREQSDRLRTALRRRIEEARLSDPSAGYAVHLRTALDYRSWFSFTVRVTDSARPEVERVLSHRTALSQGEQRVVSYVVLFAAAAAHFTSIGRASETAPRLILLDDAFAKVDEPTHGNLLGLLVDLDLDFICTSERLWGTFPSVPSLHIYECLREPTRRGVATVHYTWDGQHKRLVSV